MPASGGLAVYNARRFTCDSTAYPRIFVAFDGGLAMLRKPVQASGAWEGYNLVIHELAHKLDMLSGSANGLPPLHPDMRVSDWAKVMQHAYDDLNRQLDRNPGIETVIDQIGRASC